VKTLDRFLKKRVTVSENILHDEPWAPDRAQSAGLCTPSLRRVRIVFPVQMSASMNVNITPSGEIWKR